MKKVFALVVLAHMAVVAVAQKKKVSIEELYGGAYRTERMDVLRSMENGKQYTLLNFDRKARTTSIDQYDYKTLEKVATLVNSADLDGVDYFTSYEFSADESKILLATQVEPIFRRSTLGIFYVYDVASKGLTKISDDKIQEPSLSPDGSKVAYVKDNNLYVMDLVTKKTKQITQDGEKNKIINGVTDWVYEEEFAFVRAFAWNSNGSTIAFLRFNESQVPEFTMEIYGETLYPEPYTFKYPKAGENNSKVDLYLYDVASGQTAPVDLGDPYYIPRIQWTHDPNYLSVQTINRHQNDLKLQRVNATTKRVGLLLEETDAAYVDITDDLTFLPDDSFIWTSEKDGHNHIYLYNKQGQLQNQITKGDWEVTSYYGYNPKEDRVYYQSTENGSINRGVYAIGTDGKHKTALAVTEGTNDADFSTDFTYFINTYSNATTPYRYTLNRAKDGKEVKQILDNAELSGKLADYQISPKEFSTLNINGYDLNMWMMKPVDFDPSKKYPLLMFQYSGPGSQSVANSWMGTNDYWHQMLTDMGYIVACVDGRGTGFKGRDFKKMTYKELGKYEVEDQIAAAQKLSERSYIDPDRTGIWGWSFGGFMASNCILKGSDTFEMAIAVAPVTNWRFYDSIYTERYMQTPQENASGYDENSPLNFADQLKGKFLLIHGSGDDNVHVQNSMRMIEALIQANKQFDWGIYPDNNHGIYGGNTRLQLFTKLTNFVKENL